MAELPKVTQRHTSMSSMSIPSMPMVPRLIDQRTTADGLAVPFRIASEAYGRVGRVAAEINDRRAVAAGADAGANQAVSRDENGNVSVAFLPAGTLVNDAYNKGALESYQAAFKQAARAKAVELHQQHARDPVGFKAAWDAYQETALSSADPRVRASSTVALAELGGHHHASLLQDAYNEQRQQQEGRIKNEIASLGKDVTDHLAAGLDPSSSEVLSNLERMEVAWEGLMKSGFATELQHGEFMRKFKPAMLSAYTLGKTGVLMGDVGMDDALSFSRRVAEVREAIVAGKTGLEDIDKASEADRMAAGDAFQKRQLSQLSVNKFHEQEAKARVAVEQADLINQAMGLLGDPQAFDQFMQGARPTDTGALMGLPDRNTMTTATFSALRRLQGREDLFQQMQAGKLEREALYAHYQTEMLKCGMSDDVHSCTAQVYQDASALMQEEPDGRVVDGSTLTPTQALNLYAKHQTMIASANAKNRKIETAYGFVARAASQSPSGALPDSAWKHVNTIEQHNPAGFDLSAALGVSDEPGNEGKPVISWDVAAPIIRAAGVTEMLSQGQIDFMNAARKSGNGHMLMLGARLFNAFTEIDGGPDATDKLDNFLSRKNKNGSNGDFYFWEGMAAKLRASGATDQEGIAKAAVESARQLNERMSETGEQKKQIYLQNRYPEDGMGGYQNAVTLTVADLLNDRVEGQSGTGLLWNELFGNRGHSVQANQIVGYARDPGFIAASLASENYLDPGWFNEDQTKMFSPEALIMISKTADRDIVLAQGEAEPVARASLRALNHARSSITPFHGEGRLVPWEIGRVGYEAAQANGIMDISPQDIRLGAMLQIKGEGVRVSGSPNGLMEVLFGADIEEKRLSEAVVNGLVSLEPKFGDSGMYWEVRAKQPSGEFAFVTDDDGNRMKVHAAPFWRNDDGTVGLNKVYYMRKALNDELAQGDWLDRSSAYQTWAQWHLTEGIEWVLDEGAEVRNILRRGLGAPNGWANSSGADYFDDVSDMQEARRLLKLVGDRYDQLILDARKQLDAD